MSDIINRFQNILPLVRGSLGWSAEELGDRIGVTRQTINNIERKKTPLSKTQYIAMRSVIDAEVAGRDSNDPDMDIANYLIDAFVDRPDEDTDEQRDQMKRKALLLIPAILADSTTRREASNEWLRTVGLAAAAAAGIVALGKTAIWLKNILRDK